MDNFLKVFVVLLKIVVCELFDVLYIIVVLIKIKVINFLVYFLYDVYKYKMFYS